MQKVIFPMKNMKITQGYGVGSHLGTYAIDNAGKDGGIEDVFAPFDGTIKKVYVDNTIWLQSDEKVEFADGTKDYCTIRLSHDNNVSNLKAGMKIKQGQVFYQEGTAGWATGNHVHIEVARGKFTGTGWFKNRYNIWMINNAYKPEKTFFLKDVKVIASGGYSWKKLTATPVASKVYYTVKKGDTMSAIAVKYKTTLKKLASLNPNIKNLNVIRIGQKIRVK